MKIRYIIILIILLPALDAHAGDHKLNLGVKINPLGGIASALPISLEQFVFQHRFSITAGGSIIRSRSGSSDSYYGTDGFTLNPELRYYFVTDQNKLTRTYAGSWCSYEEHHNMSYDRLGEEVHGRVYGRGAGLLFGNQWFFNNGFLVDLYFGPGYMSYSTNVNYDLNVSKGGFLVSMAGPKASGVKIRMGIMVGLAF
jgi:hypothetical protein